MKRLKTIAQAEAEGKHVYETTPPYILDADGESLESERETYWADRCEAAERERDAAAARVVQLGGELIRAENELKAVQAARVEAAQAYAEALKERDARALDWHRVEDVLPPCGVQVLVQTTEGLSVAQRSTDSVDKRPDLFPLGWIWWASCGSRSGWNLSMPGGPVVTHWALPALPDGTVPRG